jgi:type II secretory ATPase GspE/PulE/Tfp pilus assembly ATPase PilB-like protein
VDPITIGIAFAGAKAAVATIKEVIKLGKDANEIAQSIVGYFDQKAVIEKAEAVKEREKREALWDKANGVKPKKTDAELTAEAMDVVMKRRELERQEYELYEMLVWSGQGQIWDDMVKTREEMRRQIAQEEAETVKQKIIDAAKAKERKEMMQDIQLSAAVLAAFGLLMYWLVQWGISKGMWR